MFFSDIAFNLRGAEFLSRLDGGRGGVDKERSAVLNVARHIVTGDVGGVTALNEVRRID